MNVLQPGAVPPRWGATLTSARRKSIVFSLARYNSDNHLFRLLVEGVEYYAVHVVDPSGTSVTRNSGANCLKGSPTTSHQPTFQHILRAPGADGR
jgi:hypothetical protein